MMPEDERLLVHSILGHENPSGAPLFNAMDSVTSRVLNDLTEFRLSIQKQNLSQSGGGVLEHVVEVLCRHGERFTTDLCNGIQWLVLTSKKQRHPHESFVANGRHFHRDAIFHGFERGGIKRKREIHGRGWS